MRAEMHVGLHVTCTLLLYGCVQTSNASAKFSKTSRCQVLGKFIQQFLNCCHMQTDKENKADRSTLISEFLLFLLRTRQKNCDVHAVGNMACVDNSFYGNG
jgi:hypothetical protein